MRKNALAVLIVLFCVTLTNMYAKSQPEKVLADVKAVQIDPTVVPDPKEVKDESVPNLVADSLRDAFTKAQIEIGDSPIRAHMVLEKFSSGNQAVRFMVGMGTGRAVIKCRLVITDADGKTLVDREIETHGQVAYSPYQSNVTQRTQALSIFQQRLYEEIRSLK